MPLPAGAPSTGMHPFNSSLFVASFATALPASLTALIGTYEEVGFVTAINGVPLTSGDTEVTWLRSPNKAKEYIPGWMDAETITFTIEYTKATEVFLISLLPQANAKAPDFDRLQWAVILPDEGVWVCVGFLKSKPLKIEGTSDTAITLDVTIKLSGKPVFFQFAD